MKFIPKALNETADVSRGKLDRGTVFKNVLGVMLFVGGVYLLLGLIGLGLAKLIPDEWERKLSSQDWSTLSVKPAERKASLQRASAILQKLSKDEEFRDLNYEIFVFHMENPNAVAMPGGGIGLTPPLLETIQSEEALAFVIGHELGHHQNRHILRRLSRSLVIGIVGSLLFDSAGISSVNTLMTLAETSYSRHQERQADAFGLRLVHKKYGHTDNALEFFQAIRETENEPIWQKYLGSHPLTDDRMEYLNSLRQSLNAAPESK